MKIHCEGEDWTILLSERYVRGGYDTEYVVYIQHRGHTVSFNSYWSLNNPQRILRDEELLFCTHCKTNIPKKVLEKWVQVYELCVPE